MATQPNDGLAYLKTCPDAQSYVHQCAACQLLGYSPTKLAGAEIHHNLRRHIESYFPAMELNELGICEQCAAALGRIGGTHK
jgi:hypothetical protein